jgi:hypothetical protein
MHAHMRHHLVHPAFTGVIKQKIVSFTVPFSASDAKASTLTERVRRGVNSLIWLITIYIIYKYLYFEYPTSILSVIIRYVMI